MDVEGITFHISYYIALPAAYMMPTKLNIGTLYTLRVLYYNKINHLKCVCRNIPW